MVGGLQQVEERLDLLLGGLATHVLDGVDDRRLALQVDDVRLEDPLGVPGEVPEVVPQRRLALLADAAQPVGDVPVERNPGLLAVVHDVDAGVGLLLDDGLGGVDHRRVPLVVVDGLPVLFGLQQLQQVRRSREAPDVGRQDPIVGVMDVSGHTGENTGANI